MTSDAALAMPWASCPWVSSSKWPRGPGTPSTAVMMVPPCSASRHPETAAHHCARGCGGRPGRSDQPEVLRDGCEDPQSRGGSSASPSGPRLSYICSDLHRLASGVARQTPTTRGCLCQEVGGQGEAEVRSYRASLPSRGIEIERFRTTEA